MSVWKRYAVVLLVLIVASGAAYEYYGHFRANDDVARVRMTVADFGDVLQKIPLQGDPKIVGPGMDLIYGLYVHPDLLAKWKEDLKNAPGRLTSSPWPDRIDITKTTKNPDGTFTVDGNIIEIANGATSTETVAKVPVRFVLTKGPDGWQITGYQKL